MAVRKSFPLVKSSMASVFSKVLIHLSRLVHHLSVQKAGLDMLTPNLAKLSTILRDGPEQTIHTLIWCDIVNNFNRSMELSMLDEFEFRIAFQMSESDSTKLLGSTLAKMLDSHRVPLSKEGTIASEKFIPYEPPSDEWLTRAVAHICQKSLQMHL